LEPCNIALHGIHTGRRSAPKFVEATYECEFAGSIDLAPPSRGPGNKAHRPHSGLGRLTPAEFAQTINPRRDAVLRSPEWLRIATRRYRINHSNPKPLE
jgi:hypothetical protein